MDVYKKILPIAIPKFNRFWRLILFYSFFFPPLYFFLFPSLLVTSPEAALLWEYLLVRRCDLYYILKYVKFSFHSQEPNTGNNSEHLNMDSIHFSIFNKHSCMVDLG